MDTRATTSDRSSGNETSDPKGQLSSLGIGLSLLDALDEIGVLSLDKIADGMKLTTKLLGSAGTFSYSVQTFRDDLKNGASTAQAVGDGWPYND